MMFRLAPAVTLAALTLAPCASLAWYRGAPEPKVAPTPSGEEVPVRSARNLALSAQFEIIVSPKLIPMGGLRMTGNLIPWLGWHATASTSEILSKFDGGLRGYLLQSAFSPYLAVSGGVIVGHISDIDLAPIFNAMAGLELATRAGLHLYVECGALYVHAVAFTAATGVGYRF